MTTIPIDQHSALQWQGLQSQKFHGSIKTDYPHNDEMVGYSGKELPPHGKKHFTPRNGKPISTNVGIKTFEFHNQPGPIIEDKFQRKLIHHESKPKYRKELRHLTTNQSGHVEDVPFGIRTFDHANGQSNNNYCNFELFGAHKLVTDFSDQRNGIPCKSMGDKAYRTPDYSNGFFSKAQTKLEKQFVPIKISDEKKWEFKVKQEERQEDVDAVDELEKWEDRMEIQKKEPEEEKQQVLKGKIPPKKK